jgi:uncharacterized protein YydD (DUF2326 family)
MLHKIYSDLLTFKTVNFHNGLNLILAEKTEKSTHGQTRNGAGKSSLVELINTLLGGSVEKSKGSLIKHEELEHNLFGLMLDVGDQKVCIERQGDCQSRIWVRNKVNIGLDLTEHDDGRFYFSLDAWKAKLGKMMFGLQKELISQKYTPTYRSLAAYLSRTSGGFSSPDKTTSYQNTWSKQVSVSYLLMLDWKIAREFEVIRQREDLVKALAKASKEGSLGNIMGSAPDLRTEIHIQETRIERLKKSISEFRVLPEYEEKERRATEVSKQLAILSGEDTTDKEWQAQLEQALEQEKEPHTNRVERLFLEAETELPELVKRRFEEVEAFHESVVRNRREHLAQEMEGIEERISQRHEAKVRLDEECSGILSLLQSHGALDQYMKLNSLLTKDESSLELMRRKLEQTEDLNDKKSALKIEKQTALRKMRIDHTERVDSLKKGVFPKSCG